MLSLVAGILLLVASLADAVSWPLGISGVVLIILGFLQTAQLSKPRKAEVRGSL
jgi:hypothetical protein